MVHCWSQTLLLGRQNLQEKDSHRQNPEDQTLTDAIPIHFRRGL